MGYSVLSILFYLSVIYVNLIFSEIAPTTINESRNATLQLVHVIFRHGVRTPVNTYQNDPYRDSSFAPYGWGHITNEGKDELFTIGKWLHKRYRDFFGPYYKYDVLYAKASASPRTMMSLATVLAATFPPKHTPMEWNRNYNWQPIPIYTEPTEKDIHLRMTAKCPRYDKAHEDIFQLPELKHELEENAVLFRKLTKFTGQNVTNADDVWGLYITLLAEKRYGLELPKWTREYFPDRLLPLAENNYIYMAYTREMQRIKAGQFLKKMFDEMQAKAEGNLMPSERKVFMYCAHDWSITNILMALKVWKPKMPNFAALISFELHKNPKSNDYYVEIYFKNQPEGDGEEFTVPGCVFKCPLKNLIQLSQDVLPNASYEEMCRLQKNT